MRAPLAALLVTALLAGAPARGQVAPADEKAVRAVVDRLMKAMGERSVEDALACWAGDAPSRPSFERNLQRFAAIAVDVRIERVQLSRWSRSEGRVHVRLRFDWKYTDRRTGRGVTEDEIWSLQLVRAGEAWKLWRQGEARKELALQLLGTESPDKRKEILRAEKDLLTPELVRFLLVEAEKSATGGDHEAARDRHARAVEAAAALGDTRTLAWCSVYEGMLLHYQEKYEEAAAAYGRALPLFRKAGDPLGEATALNNVGMVWQLLGRLTEAIKAYGDSLKLARQQKDVEGEADTLRNLARLCYEAGRYAEALLHLEQALLLARRLEDLALEAEALNEMGVALLRMGRSREARGRLEKALDIFRRLKDAAGEARALENLGIVLQELDEYAEAERVLLASLEKSRSLPGPAMQARILHNLGRVEAARGRFDKALEHHLAALKLFQDSGSRAERAAAHDALGILLVDLGRAAEGRAQLDIALALRREGKDLAGQARVMHHLGIAHRALGEYAEALRLHDASLQIARRLGVRELEAAGLVGMGNIYEVTGRPQEALFVYQQARALDEKLGSRAGLVVVLNGLGNVHEELGQPRQAARYYLEGLRVSEELGLHQRTLDLLHNLCFTLVKADLLGEAQQGIDRYLQASEKSSAPLPRAAAHYLLGLLRRRQDRLDDALTAFEAARRLAQPLGADDLLAHIHEGIGSVLARRGRWQEAAPAFAQAVALVEKLRFQTREPLLQTTLLGKNTLPYRQLARCLLALEKPAEALATLERMRARTLGEILQQGRVSPRHGMTAEESRHEEALTTQLNTLSVQLSKLGTLREVEPGAFEAIHRRRDEVRLELETLERRVLLAHPELEVPRAGFKPASLGDLQEQLFAASPGLAILSYALTPRELMIFVLTAGPRPDGPAQLRWHTVDLTEGQLAEEVSDFRAYCRNPADTLGYDTERLYRWLLAPVEEEVRGKTHLLIVPDTQLNLLPFQAIRDGEDRYLLERFSISYAPSATMLLATRHLARLRRQDTAPGASLLAVGRPLFGKDLKDLPATGREVRALAPLFGGERHVLEGKDACREKVLPLLGRASHLHFATHGLISETAPLFSSIALTPGEADDGRLTARELMEVKLRARLVVLSACETALGQDVYGEGILGLTWALFVAGTPASVVTQWSVNDASTSGLMEAFYRGLLGEAKVPTAEALRQAQLAMLKDRKHRHPYFWAPFVLVGDWR